jgi:ectoine hydroxylase-related dioxygenase (phytanoyl-CoA dioxygenase family)
MRPDGDQTFDDEVDLQLFQNEVLHRVASTLLRTPAVRVFDGSVGITLRHDWGDHPGVRSACLRQTQLSQRLHIDNGVPADVDAFLLSESELEIGGCFYFTDVAEGGGGIAVVPGGHRLVAEEVAGDPQGRHRRLNWGMIEGYPEPVEITGSAGDFVMLHYLTPHAATYNRNETTRVVKFLRWVRMDNPYGLAGPVPPTRYNARQLEALTPLGRKLVGVDAW